MSKLTIRQFHKFVIIIHIEVISRGSDIEGGHTQTRAVALHLAHHLDIFPGKENRKTHIII